MTTPKHYQQLQYTERMAIASYRVQGLSIRLIARILNRAASTISREIVRNAPSGQYSCTFAQTRRNRRRVYCRAQPKLHITSALFSQVCQLLRCKWSPEQIAIHLRRHFPDDSNQRVSHETIYNAIYAMPKGELRKELIALMRRAQAKRMPRSRGQERRGKIVDMVSIHVRPPEVNDRLFPGHWEADFIKGKANASAVGTLVERSTRLLILIALPGPKPASAATVLQAFTDKLRSIAGPMRQSMTYDQGSEMARHYLPKGTDLSGYSQDQLDAIADEINNRPRKTLNAYSPLEVYRDVLINHHVAPTTIH